MLNQYHGPGNNQKITSHACDDRKFMLVSLQWIVSYFKRGHWNYSPSTKAKDSRAHHVPESCAQREHTSQIPMQVWVRQWWGAATTSDEQYSPEMSWILQANQTQVAVRLVPVQLIDILEGGTWKLPLHSCQNHRQSTWTKISIMLGDKLSDLLQLFSFACGIAWKSFWLWRWLDMCEKDPIANRYTTYATIHLQWLEGLHSRLVLWKRV